MNTPDPMMRQTSQRQIILEELAKVKTHPTANDLHGMVRKRLPRIGLGTVYRNLEFMSNKGMIRKLEVGGTHKRFDAITKPHYHIRCTCCGKVEDIGIAITDDIVEMATKGSSYQITGYNIEFTGACLDCQVAQSSTATP